MSINQRLHNFSAWFDEFLLEIAKPLALVGFAMGTVDIFTRGGIATNPWFNVPWAIVQAATIDGLFFTVWYRVFSPGTKGKPLMVAIGLILALVAMITNGILSLQQLQNIRDSISAMAWIGIDPVTFTLGRAVLVVFVSIMVAFVYYQRNTVPAVVLAGNSQGTAPEQLGNTVLKIVPRSEQWNTDWNNVLEQWNNTWNTLGTELFSTEQWTEHSGTISGTAEQLGRTAGTIVEQSEQLPEQSEQLPEPSGRESRQPLLLAEQTEQTDRDKIREAMSTRRQTNRPINLVEVAEETGVLYSRVRKLAPGIKRELNYQP